MLTKCKDVRRLAPKKGVNKLFENVLCKCRIQNFFHEGGRRAHFDIFWAELLQGKSRNKNSFKGVGGTLPQKFFENLGSLNSHFSAFAQFSRKILFKFLLLILSPSPK